MRSPAKHATIAKKSIKIVDKTKTSKPTKPETVKTIAKNVNEIAIGAKAPAFSIPATIIGTAKSTKLKGKPYLLYFYPKDDTSGCTVEACAFRDALPNFSKLGLAIIGVSKDTLASHEKFAMKYSLNFPLASDEDGDLCAKFGVWKQKSMYGRTYMGIERSTFLIDAKGIIRNVWRKVSVPGHADEVEQAIAEL
jgi:peroxiredoxin Q/BCP